jgi:hypothetical protein
LFDNEERSVKILGKMAGRVTALLMAAVLFSVPLSVQPCQMAEVSQNSCCFCCLNSSEFSHLNDAERQECPCQMDERQQEVSSLAVIVSNQDSKPETFSVASEVEEITKESHTQFTGLCPHSFLPVSKDPPLYLLHSSFLI